jgi:hypothetical protein
MSNKNEVREAFEELVDNLKTVGMFSLGEAKSFLRTSPGASREQFFASVDKAARTMKQSGKLAQDDVERSVERIKKAWEVLDKEKTLDWDKFFDDVKTRMGAIGDLSQDTFDLFVNQAKEALDKQWTATGRLGEEQLDWFRNQSELVAKAFKSQWDVFSDRTQETGEKVDRAAQAAWEAAWKELKGKEEKTDD